MRDYFNQEGLVRFLFPIDGDCVNDRDGKKSEEGILLTARVFAAEGCTLQINGVPARAKGNEYLAEVLIKEGRNELTASNLTDGTTATVSVFFYPRCVGKYRISSDDNILFLADITANKDVYTSIFDNPYLAVYKRAHDLYGAKVHLNLFYAFDREAAALFSAPHPDFDLSMMTDKFKAEWRANADWLKLSFHARKEFPNKPYQHAAAETIVADYKAVRREILRFAGEECFSEGVTTVHWGEANPACVAALHALGPKTLAGYFELDNGEPLVAYYAPPALVKHVGDRDFFVDTAMGVTFARIDLVTNIDTLEERMEQMRAIIADPHRGGFVSFMIHEQYFYEDYNWHLPDFADRVLEPARLLAENGYRGTHLCEVLGEA